MFIAVIMGRLGKDPESRFTPNGQKVTTFTVATNHRKGKEDVTVWVRVSIWGDRFDKMLPYLKKGSLVVVHGRMNPPSSYVDREGKTQFSLEMTAEMMEFGPSSKSERSEEGGAQSNYQAPGKEEDTAGDDLYASYSRSGNSYSNAGSARSSYGTQAGASHNTTEEDPLPF